MMYYHVQYGYLHENPFYIKMKTHMNMEFNECEGNPDSSNL